MTGIPEILMAERWQPGHAYVPGSTHDRLCQGCGRFVVLAPSSAALLERRPIPLLCAQCAIAAILERP